jgi:hypothetical protein
MLRGLVNDAREVLREMPWFAAAVLLVMALCVGLNAAVFYEADGDEVLVSASKTEPQAMGSDAEPMSRMRAHVCSENKTPGFTVIIALRQYSLELSVPVTGVRSMFDDARASVANVFDEMDAGRAA